MPFVRNGLSDSKVTNYMARPRKFNAHQSSGSGAVAGRCGESRMNMGRIGPLRRRSNTSVKLPRTQSLLFQKKRLESRKYGAPRRIQRFCP